MAKEWQNSGRVVVVGLGNPGPKYAGTRHNVGFMLAEDLVRECGGTLSREKFHARYDSVTYRNRDAVVLLPQTYMNRSGQTVAAAL